MSTENAVVDSVEVAPAAAAPAKPRPRNSRTAFVKAWQAAIDPATGEADADAVAVALGVSRQTVMQKSSDLRTKGVPLAPVKRKESASNGASLADLAALAASLAPAKPEAAPAVEAAPAA